MTVVKLILALLYINLWWHMNGDWVLGIIKRKKLLARLPADVGRRFADIQRAAVTDQAPPDNRIRDARSPLKEKAP